MDGPGPSTQANAAARALRAARAARRASGEESSGAQESQRAPFPNRQPRAGEDEEREQEDGEEGDSEEEDSEDENDSEHDENGNEKKPVYHWQIWRKLLRMSSMRRKGSREGLVRYVNREPQRGDHPLDITAVYTPQMHWDLENRSFWPANLKLWGRPSPWNNPTYNVGVMKYKGHVVLDFTGTPIRNFRIPLTISSSVEGLRIESWMRSDDRLTLGDIEARMWTKDAPDGGKMPFFNRRTLSKRASLARLRAGLISWVGKKGRDKQTALLDGLRTPQQRANNLATDQDTTANLRANYSNMGLDENKESNARTREDRIKKIKRAAAGGTVTASSSGAADVGSADRVATAGREDDNLVDPDSDDGEADPETQVQEQASENIFDESSVSSSLTDLLDSRHDQPTNPEEEALLQRALKITIDDFFSLTAEEPMLTDPGENYFSQWAVLQAQLRTLWLARGNMEDVPDAPYPKLRARGRWTGGISQFELAEEIEGDWYTFDDESE